MSFKRLAFAALGLSIALAGAALAQTQPVPGAIGYNGAPMQTQPIAIEVAPAGGGSGLGRVVAEDDGLPIKTTPSTSAAAGRAYTTTAAVSSGVVLKATPGNLYSLNVVAGASALYVLVIDATTIPADGAVTPKWCFPVAANAPLDKTFPVPLRGEVGLVVVASLTGCYLKTASATALIGAQFL